MKYAGPEIDYSITANGRNIVHLNSSFNSFLFKEWRKKYCHRLRNIVQQEGEKWNRSNLSRYKALKEKCEGIDNCIYVRNRKNVGKLIYLMLNQDG